ncbi:site-specific integrase [Psychroflexus sp. YR1-1]|uniref:Site-specific integrase n=1 Tax=Psychroflexus aurantiacus TaxID=2709310 RepID=A0A6B3R2S8_9FLAO|nr:tyrosine-type recombinase/integrase [Psychroflexus aurantiacus]NEV93045.1 site-specific integrase [Psychroflexus aurantiacus]
MANSRFSIKKNKSGTGTIKLIFNFGKHRKIEYYTPYKVLDVTNWDRSNNKIKVGKQEDAASTNDKLKLLDSAADKLISKHINEGIELTKELIKSRMESVITEREVDIDEIKTKEKNQDFIKYFEWYLDFYKQHPRPKTKKPYNKGTLKTLRNTKELLERFQKNKKRLTFDDITLSFHQKLLSYMSENDYSMNYKGTIIKNIKAVMHDAFERDFHRSLDYTKSAFTKPTEEVENVYLTEEEIKKIAEVDLNEVLKNKDNAYFDKNTKKPSLNYLERCIDFFLIGCHTGLRVSDLLELNQSNILTFEEAGQTMTAIAIKNKKTGKRVEIPIKKELQDILEKYDNNFPSKVSDAKVNLYIKPICKAAGLNEPVEMKITEGGKTLVTSVPKYDRVSNHTARRSFCTNAYNAGMQPTDIMTISGHTTEKSFFTYIKSTSRERFSKIKGHAFFQ